ncbi:MULTISPECIES: hypothetical protein [unclassified Paenibacillus]|uniref:WD40/YVTN/BNR-like repeat-containing protein n=1 Tax=unclassified Paenibacillus TaxID=185978 RepID=UPI000953A929|nr:MULTISPECIES: hypothetical protein [unclassified Paenibacillus]ASS67936.1 hypothetical protein CIC07_18735 [Paenibacillus sp. RUD330]SIR43491.1 Uncharacterized protein SAMN05880555_3803 [Paenibacillus sp. RU4X]SIR53443.1 Uncharacterized protein SAMN05880570_3805 [Paenibacillus sp. RU4T]
MDKKLHLAAVLLTASCLILGSCGQQRQDESWPEGSAAASVPAGQSSGKAGGSPAAGAADVRKEPIPAVPADAGAGNAASRGRLTGMQWLDGDHGYAWERTGDKFYRTDNGGEDWQDAAPPAASAFPGGLDAGKAVYFFDAMHGWICMAPDQGPTLVFRTDDGGRTWKESRLPVRTEPTGMQFVTPSQGWLMTSADAAMGSTEKTLYVTADGGLSWKPSAGSSYAGEAKGMLPEREAVTGMHFTDASNGWLAFGSHDPAPVLYRTKDGGKAWSKVRIEPASDVRYGAGGPEFPGGQAQFGFALVYLNEGADRRRLDAYVTNDGGNHWSFQPWNLERAAAFADARHGWGWRNGGLVATADGGSSWREIPAGPALRELLRRFPVPIIMQFTGAGDGWLLLGKNGEEETALLRTKDGGATWTAAS